MFVRHHPKYCALQLICVYLYNARHNSLTMRLVPFFSQVRGRFSTPVLNVYICSGFQHSIHSFMKKVQVVQNDFVKEGIAFTVGRIMSSSRIEE